MISLGHFEYFSAVFSYHACVCVWVLMGLESLVDSSREGLAGLWLGGADAELGNVKDAPRQQNLLNIQQIAKFYVSLETQPAIWW